jgi:hypothetical protein
MTDFEQRLRAAMESSVAGEQPPGNLVERIRRRRRRHAARVAVAGVVVMTAAVAAVPVTGMALLGGGGPSRAASPGPGPHPRATRPAPRGQYYGCASQTLGALGPHWRKEGTQAGSLWIINKGIAPNFAFYNRNGSLKAVPLIVLLRDNTVARVQPSGTGSRYFRFLPGFNSTDQYTLPDGKPAATFASCSGQDSMYGNNFTEFYIGVIVRGPRCITLDVRTPAARQPVPVRLTFGTCGTGQ